ncbi:MAG: Rpp14/Pop5 family protein [Candidatus Micrarchaeia archaeon]
MREKKRYLRVKFEGKRAFDEKTAKHLVYNSVFELLGEAGAAKANAFLKQFNEKTQVGVVKCKTAMLEETIAALALKRFENGEGIALRLQKISGNIGKLV